MGGESKQWGMKNEELRMKNEEKIQYPMGE